MGANVVEYYLPLLTTSTHKELIIEFFCQQIDHFDPMLVFDIELFTIVTPAAPKKIEAVTPPIEVKPAKPKDKAAE